jgi:hypothetical protein
LMDQALVTEQAAIFDGGACDRRTEE